MALTIPPGVDANGRRNAIFVPTDTLSVATLNGATAVELMCYLSKGTFGMASETERGTDDRECTLVSSEVLGNTKYSLNDWAERLRADTGDKFPEKVTAFRKGMAVHGRYKEPCPRCGSKVQRIRYATNETNYCPTCQTGGRLLADRALSRLLRENWPKTAEELG
jgi:hypothetical protein